MPRRRPNSTLFPYTTLFRSRAAPRDPLRTPRDERTESPPHRPNAHFESESLAFHHQAHMRVRLSKSALARLPSRLSVAVRVRADGDLSDLRGQIVNEHLSAADVFRFEQLARRRDGFVSPFRNILQRCAHMRGVRFDVV